MKIYIRARDKQTVSRDEAVTPGGMLREGYSLRVPAIADGGVMMEGEHLGFDVAFMDSGPANGGRIAFRDATVADAALNDARVTHDVARAEATHRTRYAYLGDKAPVFTDAMRDTARAAATASRMQDAARLQDSGGIRHAETVTARIMRDVALAKRRIELANAWKR